MKSRLSKVFLCLSVVLQTFTLQGFVNHLCLHEHVPHPIAHYELIDLKETDLDASQLTKSFKSLSLAPRLNADGVVIGNHSAGGFVRFPSGKLFVPNYEGMSVHFYGINLSGDLLVAISRGQDSLEWLLWPCDSACYQSARQHIKTLDPFKGTFRVTAFNDQNQVAVSALDCKKIMRPFVWNASTSSFARIGWDSHWDIQGTIHGLNNKGGSVGILDLRADQMPFMLHPTQGLLFAHDYRKHLVPMGWTKFSELLLTDDSTVYGNFYLQHLASHHKDTEYEHTPQAELAYKHHAFKWNPLESNIEMLDLQGMRLTSVNNRHVLAGSLQGEAAICLPGSTPVALNTLMHPGQVKDWQLLEATDINDHGQLVGYGTYQGKMHLFLASPLR